MSNRLIGYQSGQGFLYDLSGASKMLFFILVSVACMATYDPRFILAVGLLSIYLFYLAKIRWRDISFVVKIIGSIALFNLLMVYLFAPGYGEEIYGAKTVIIEGWGRFYLTSQELFYLANLFLMTTHPSQFAASLNQIGVPYKFAYSVSLTLRYIPDVQEEFFTIRKAQEARGLDLSQKAGLVKRIRGNLQIVLPLIFSSLERIDTISTAMELRRFGRYKKRTWYVHKSLLKQDYLVILSAILILGISIGLIFLNHGRFYNPWG